MRTLKFRRYNAYLKEMDEPIDWLPGERTDTDFWMQFTGLLDRHGKEIYEDDILKGLGGNKDIGVVFFARGCFIVEDWYNGMSEGDFSDHPYFEDTEVIGNIWENPELLK